MAASKILKFQMRAVIDTNVLLVSISSRSSYHWLYKSILANTFEIAFSSDILTEYEELISQHWHPDVAVAVIRSLLELPNAIATTVFYQLNLIKNDPDDNKFADCAFTANADYLVTEDKDFDVLKKISFPKINVIA